MDVAFTGKLAGNERSRTPDDDELQLGFDENLQLASPTAQVIS